MGRTLLFSEYGEAKCDRLPASTIFGSPSKARPEKSLLKQHMIRLNCADLFDLAFWVESKGAAASPFAA
jgi:hypothetical protein